MRKNGMNAETVNFWLNTIKQAKDNRDRYDKRCDVIEKRYREERKDISLKGFDKEQRRYNILYSNTQIKLPVLYSNQPKAECRNKRAVNSPVYGEAAEIMEAALDNCIDSYDFDSLIENVVRDFCLFAMGQAKLCYYPTFEDDNENAEILYEELRFKYYSWKDFYWVDAQCWDEVPAVFFRGHEDREGLYKISDSKEIANEVELDYEIKSTKTRNSKEVDKNFKRATVWEIWDKQNRQRLYIAEGYKESPLAIEDNPYSLEGFFPCPEPLFGTQTGSTLEPVPNFIYYQDQADELDIITERIASYTEELRRRGVYDSSMPEVAKAYEAPDNTFYPVEDARFSEKGGLSGMFSEFDNSQLIVALRELQSARQEILNIIFQIEGISDIMRGSTDPRETLGAQSLKGKYGTLRISREQRKVQRFIRDMIRLKGEMIAENFEPESLVMLADIQPRTFKVSIDGQEFEREQSAVDYVKSAILPVLRASQPRSIGIDIETDSTIAIDEQEEQKMAIEFVGVMTNFAEASQALNAVFGVDITAQIAKDLMRKFKMSRSIMAKFDDRIEELEQQAAQPQQPSVEERKLALEEQKLQLKAAGDSADNQLKARELQLREIELGVDSQIKQQEVDIKASNSILDQQARRAEMATPGNEFVGV